MEKSGWKTTAIIFIILFILETAFLIWAVNLGYDEIEKENECAINICEDYGSYYYDGYEGICYCYNDGKIEKTEYMTKNFV